MALTVKQEAAAQAYKWYVYELVDPANSEVFYVGKGSGKRINVHGTSYDKSNPKKLNKILSIGLDKIIRRKIAYFNDEQLAYKFESDRICELLWMGKLTNISIATTIIRKGIEPDISIKQCIRYIKDLGYTLIYDPNKCVMSTYDKKHYLPDSFMNELHSAFGYVFDCLKKWSAMGFKIPETIKSFGVTVNLRGRHASR